MNLFIFSDFYFEFLADSGSKSDEEGDTVDRLGFRRASNITRRRSSIVIRENPLHQDPQIRNRRESRRSVTVLQTEGRD